MKNLNIKPINKMKHDVLLHDKPNGVGTECVGMFKGNKDAALYAALNVSMYIQTPFKIKKDLKI